MNINTNSDNLANDIKDLSEQFNKIGGSEEKTKYNKLVLGFHTSKNNKQGIIPSLHDDSQLLITHGFKPAAQIFTQVPATSVFSKIEPQSTIIKFMHDRTLSLVIHSPYAINNFWKSGDLTKLHNSLKNAEMFVQAEKALGSKNSYFKGIVVHLPKQTPEAVVNVIKNRQYPDVPILLENHAYKPGDDSYELPHKLNKLTELLIKHNTPNWGYCIDTAHLFVCISKEDRKAGYRIEERSCMENWLSQLTNETRSRIQCWHLNGSINASSSHDDKHAIPIFGDGHSTSNHVPDQMWGDLLMKEEILANGLDKHLQDQLEALQNSSLVPILKHAMTNNIPVILEINRGNAYDITGCLKVFAKLEHEINTNLDF